MIPAKSYGDLCIEKGIAEPTIDGKGTKKKSPPMYFQPVDNGKNFLQSSKKIYSIR